MKSRKPSTTAELEVIPFGVHAIGKNNPSAGVSSETAISIALYLLNRPGLIDLPWRRTFGTKSEKFNPEQLHHLLDPDAAKKAPAAAPADLLPATEIPTHKRPAKKPPRQPRIPQHLPLTEEILDPAEVLAKPNDWRQMGEEVREQLHFKHAGLNRIRSGDALTKPLIAPLPPSFKNHYIANPALIAEVVDNRFTCHLPYYRQSEIFSRLVINLHRKTLCDWTLLASGWLSIIYQQIQY